jgi:hypothetical protein
MYHTPLTALPAQVEWQPDIERLRNEIETARKTGNLEHLAIAEAECWIDLIDAELVARRDTDDPEIQRLRSWRTEISAMLNR